MLRFKSKGINRVHLPRGSGNHVHGRRPSSRTTTRVRLGQRQPVRRRGANPKSMKDTTLVGFSIAQDVLPANQGGPTGEPETTCRKIYLDSGQDPADALAWGLMRCTATGSSSSKTVARPRAVADVAGSSSPPSSGSATSYDTLTELRRALRTRALRRRRARLRPLAFVQGARACGSPAPRTRSREACRVAVRSSPAAVCVAGCAADGLLFRQDRRVRIDAPSRNEKVTLAADGPLVAARRRGATRATSAATRCSSTPTRSRRQDPRPLRRAATRCASRPRLSRRRVPGAAAASSRPTEHVAPIDRLRPATVRGTLRGRAPAPRGHDRRPRPRGPPAERGGVEPPFESSRGRLMT